MRVKFRAAEVKDVILFVHRLSATERASIEIAQRPGSMEVEISLSLVRTSLDDLKRFMESVGGDRGWPLMVNTLQVEDTDTHLEIKAGSMGLPQTGGTS